MMRDHVSREGDVGGVMRCWLVVCGCGSCGVTEGRTACRSPARGQGRAGGQRDRYEDTDRLRRHGYCAVQLFMCAVIDLRRAWRLCHSWFGHRVPGAVVAYRYSVAAAEILCVQRDRVRHTLSVDRQRRPVDVVEGVGSLVIVRVIRLVGGPAP